MLEPLSACLRLVAQALWRRINPFMQRLNSCDTDHIVSDRVAMQYAVRRCVCLCVPLFACSQSGIGYHFFRYRYHF